MRAAFLLILAACGDPAREEPPVLPGTEEPPCELVSEGYRIIELDLPADATQAGSWALDLDGDGRGDNTIGYFAAGLLTGPGAHPPVDEAVDVIMLDPTFALGVNVERCADQRLDHLRVELLAGTFDPESNTLFVELGGIPSVGASNEAVLGRGFLPLSAFVDVQTDPDAVEWAEGVAVTVTIEETVDTYVLARLAAGFRGDTALPILARAVARTANWALANDPGCPDACEGFAVIGEAFDDDLDGTVTEAEVLADDIFRNVLPALDDLFAGDVFWPGHDGDEDAISVAFRFTAERVDLWPPQ